MFSWYAPGLADNGFFSQSDSDELSNDFVRRKSGDLVDLGGTREVSLGGGKSEAKVDSRMS